MKSYLSHRSNRWGYDGWALLMPGANPAFVAAQLGHSMTMTLTVYGKWISGAADQR